MKLQGYISAFDEGNTEEDTYIVLRLSGSHFGGGSGHTIKGTLRINMKRGLMKDYKIGDQFEVSVEGKNS